MGTIRNAGSIPLNQQPMGTVPDVSGALQDYYQSMVFMPVVKTVAGFVVSEVGSPINFRGNLQPLSERRLALKPEGERGWTWFMLHCDTALQLDIDDVVQWRGKATRVMGRKDFALYGYIYYELVQDWTGSGP
jgi:hypothetical protein